MWHLIVAGLIREFVNNREEQFMYRTLMTSIMLCLLLAPVSALAYIGPGGGLSALGALLALLMALAVAFVGFVWYPLKRIRRKRRLAAERVATEATTAKDAATEPTHSVESSPAARTVGRSGE